MTTTTNARTFASVTEAALWYVEQGILPVPVAYRGKNPKGNDWEKLRIDAASVPDHFNGHPQNIGALLGISGTGASGLADVDQDSPEAIALAPAFLPNTEFIFGRATKPASHRFYFTDPPVRLLQFKDPLTKGMLLELRGAKKNGTVGLQTVLPGSVHVSGEPITFEAGHDSAPTPIAAGALTFAVCAVAAGALLCRYWPAHGRHDAMLALAASLARNEWSAEEALTFCRAVYQAVPTHDPAAVSRVDSEVTDSFAKVAAGAPATGFPSLTNHIDKKVVETAFGWLGFKTQPSPQLAGGVVGGADWQTEFLLTERGMIKPLLANALLVIHNAPEWAGTLAYNQFSLCTVAKKPAPWPQSVAGENWTDFDDSQLAAWLQRYGVGINSRIAAEAAQTVAQENSFHPVRDYLEGLTWDQTERIDLWLTTYLGAQDSPYIHAVGARWLISGVARIFIPGCQADCVLLLEGPQGIMKSSALRALAGDEWFSDCVSELGSKDSKLELAGNLIVEVGECDRIKRGDLERVKGFLSTRVDKFRPPYGRRTANFPRSCIFAATTNDESCFADETGNRRFWPVRCGHIDVEALKRDRDQLWAEAVVKFRAGIPWWLDTKELSDAASREQNERYQPGIWDEEVLNFCDAPEPREKRADDHLYGPLPFDSSAGQVTINDVLVHAIGKPFDKITYADRMQVQRCLVHDGWQRLAQSRVKDGTGRRVRFYVKKGTS